MRYDWSQWREDWRTLFPTLREFIIQWHQRSSRRHQLILLLLMMIGVMMRLQFLYQPIRTDEALTYLQYASGNLLQPLYDYSAPNNHILHTIGVSLTTRLLSNSEWSIRLTTFISGITLILTTYLMSALLMRRHSALIGAGLVAVGASMIEYSTNARGYMLQANCLMLMISFILLWQRRPNRFLWLGAVISASLGFYTVPTMLYAFMGVMLWWLVNATTQKSQAGAWRWWLGAGVTTTLITLMLYTPVFIVNGLGAITSNQYVAPQSNQELFTMWGQMIQLIWSQWHVDVSPILQGIFLIGFLWGLRQERQGRLALAVAIMIVIAIFLMIQRVAPFTRIFLIFFPIYASILGAGLHALSEKAFGKRGHVVAISTLLIIVGVQAVTITQTQSPYWSLETGTMRDAQAIIHDLSPEVAEGMSIIYQHPSEKSLEYYALRSGMDRHYIMRSYQPTPTLFVVLNHEYAHTVESVFAHNALSMQAYELVEHWRHYPLADVYRYVLRED